MCASAVETVQPSPSGRLRSASLNRLTRTLRRSRWRLFPPTKDRSTDIGRPPRAPAAAWAPSPAAFYPDRCSQSSANEVPDPSARGQGTTSGEPARGCHNIVGPVEVRLLRAHVAALAPVDDF